MSLSASMMSAGTALPGLGVWADLARELSRSTSCCVLMGSVMLQLGNIPSLSPADPAASPGWLPVSPPPSGELHLANKHLVWAGGRQAGACVCLYLRMHASYMCVYVGGLLSYTDCCMRTYFYIIWAAVVFKLNWLMQTGGRPPGPRCSNRGPVVPLSSLFHCQACPPSARQFWNKKELKPQILIQSYNLNYILLLFIFLKCTFSTVYVVGCLII